MNKIIKILFLISLSITIANASDDIAKCKQAISYFENFDKIWDDKDRYDAQEFLPLRSACKIAVEQNPKNTEYRIALARLQLNLGEEESIKNLETAIQQGSDKARVLLSTLMLLGAGQQQDWDTFKQHLDILQDMAKAGNVDALKSSVAWWQIYEEKGLLKYSTKELMSLIEKEAKKGDRQLQQLLGLMHHTDGTEVESMHWYVKAAEQGNRRAGGVLFLSLSQDYDKLSEKVKAEVNKIITSAELGNPYAQNILADAYEWSDPEQSLMWRKKAAENGNINSQYQLGTLYSYKKDLKKAKYWLNKAIDQGSKAAKIRLRLIEKRIQ